MLPAQARDWFITNSTAKYVEEMENRLNSAAEWVHPPVLIIGPDGNTLLSFVIWIQAFGRLVELRNFLAPDGSFTYESTELAVMVGDYVVPK